MTSRILYICHNHPSLHPGGTEIFSHDLFQEMKTREGVQALFLACTNDLHRKRRPGTSFQAAGDTPDELLLWSGHFDEFNHSQIDLYGVVPELEELLSDYRPDVVHFHHLLLIGVEALQIVKRVTPKARIVFTLHDYYPICHNGGQMVRVGTRELCRKASPLLCHCCFPEYRPDQFLVREEHVKNFFRLVDVFISPSHFLRKRFIEWGLPEDKIVVIPNGRPGLGDDHAEPIARETRSVFGYFGNVSPSKGTLVALEAARLLVTRGRTDFSLAIHGDPLFQTDEFKDSFQSLLKDTAPCVTHYGAYERSDLPSLLHEVDWVIMASVWWENAPLVIQEAFRSHRPVICSNVGGMAEAVQNRSNGLHFQIGNAGDLARVMAQAIDDPHLWTTCQSGIVSPPDISEVADRHLALYRNADETANLVIASADSKGGQRRRDKSPVAPQSSGAAG